MKIKVGDLVSIISGKDKNKTGKVLKTYNETHQILVEGINIATKHIKKSQSGEQGRIVKIEKAIDISNVMLICPFTQQRTRVVYTGTWKDKKRVSKKASKAIEDTIKDSKKKI